MSVRVQSWVWHHSRARQTSLLVALALADHAHDDGSGAYPSIATIAQMARCSERQVQRAIKDLTRLGELTVEQQASPRNTNVYVFPLVAGVTPMSGRQNVGGDTHVTQGVTSMTPGGDIHGQQGVTPMSPEPSVKPSINQEISPPVVPPLPNPRKSSRATQITSAFTDSLVEEFADALGGEAIVRETIDRALNHKASKQWIDRRRGLRDWLKRDAERKGVVIGRPLTAAELDARGEGWKVWAS